MSCPIDLQDALNTPDAGGTWTFDGFNANSANGAPGSGGTNPGTLNGDNPSVDFGGFVPGYYFFTYSIGVGSCQDSQQTYIHVVAVPSAGTDNTSTYCTDDDTVVGLFGQLGGNPSSGGTWSVPSGNTPPNGTNLGNGTLDLSQITSPGQWDFVYTTNATANNGETLADCAQDCENSATVTIIVNEGADAGQANPLLVCN